MKLYRIKDSAHNEYYRGAGAHGKRYAGWDEQGEFLDESQMKNRLPNALRDTTKINSGYNEQLGRWVRLDNTQRVIQVVEYDIQDSEHSTFPFTKFVSPAMLKKHIGKVDPRDIVKQRMEENGTEAQ